MLKLKWLFSGFVGILLSLPCYGFDEYKLSPKIRSISLSEQKKLVDIDAIRPYITNLIILPTKTTSTLPIITSVNQSLLADSGEQVFIKDLQGYTSQSQFTCLEMGKMYKDPTTGEELGQLYKAVGTLIIDKFVENGAVLRVLETKGAINKGTKVIPRTELNIPERLEATKVTHNVQGYIIGAENVIEHVGSLGVLSLNLGNRDGIQAGNILDVVHSSKQNKLASVDPDIVVPDRKIGEVMVYHVFDKMSLAILLEHDEPIRLMHQVQTPGQI